MKKFMMLLAVVAATIGSGCRSTGMTAAHEADIRFYDRCTNDLREDLFNTRTALEAERKNTSSLAKDVREYEEANASAHLLINTLHRDVKDVREALESARERWFKAEDKLRSTESKLRAAWNVLERMDVKTPLRNKESEADQRLLPNF